MKRAIHIFPAFRKTEKIQDIRYIYDPLSDKIPPHITLVFPFESRIPQNELFAHVQSLANAVAPFNLTMNGVTGSGGKYLFLNVKQGNDALIHLHNELYTGILAPFRNHHITYTPHITLGRIKNQEECTMAVEKYKGWEESFHTVVKEVVIEEIGEDDHSHVIGRIRLDDNRF